MFNPDRVDPPDDYWNDLPPCGPRDDGPTEAVLEWLEENVREDARFFGRQVTPQDVIDFWQAYVETELPQSVRDWYALSEARAAEYADEFNWRLGYDTSYSDRDVA